MIKQMSGALDFQGAEARDRDICRALLRIVREKVEEDQRDEDLGRGYGALAIFEHFLVCKFFRAVGLPRRTVQCS